MLCCLNPNCPGNWDPQAKRSNPVNLDTAQHCEYCQTHLIHWLPGKKGNYKPLAVIGQGGLGRTYLAEAQNRNPSKCVLKQLLKAPGEPQAERRAEALFDREANQLEILGIDNPQIPEFIDYFQYRLNHNNYFFLVQQFIQGKSLAQELQKDGIWNETKVRKLLQDILPVLAIVHDHRVNGQPSRVIHRDIKPDNLMRREDNTIHHGKIVLIDFGVSRNLEGSLMATAIVPTTAGTFGYMSPEQNDGEAYPSSDLYSLGATCFCLLSGQDPNRLWQRYAFGWPQHWKSCVKQPISPELEKVLDKLLQYDHTQRYQSAGEVLDALAKPAKSSQRPHPQPPVEKPVKTSRSVDTLYPVKTSPLSGGRRSFLQWFWGFMVTGVAGALALDYFGGREEPIPENPTPEQPPQIINYELPNNGGTLELIRIPAGTLVMKGGHRVTLQEFYMGKYAVTQRQYQAVMNTNPSAFTGDLDRPVEQVDWNNAVNFCNRLDERDGKKVQLPSETQWEWAARGATESKGYTYAGSNDLDEVGWYNKNSNRTTHPVGQKAPNELGLYDMSGNVREWCQDNGADNANALPTNGTPLTNGGNNVYRAVRGGSWLLGSDFCRSGNRNNLYPVISNSDLGFRVVLLLS
jgi:serine/threonine protein kinase